MKPNQELKTVYKVVRVNAKGEMYSANRCTRQTMLRYTLNRTRKPVIENSLLYAFSDATSAMHFATCTFFTDDSYCILECDAEVSDLEPYVMPLSKGGQTNDDFCYFWSLDNRQRQVRQAPRGTVLCSKIIPRKIVYEVNCEH